MRRNIVFLVTLLLLAGLLSSCKSETSVFRLSFEGKVGDELFALGQSYPHQNGQAYQLERFRFLLSDLVLIDGDGEEVFLESDMLVDLGEGTFRTADGLTQDGAYMEWEIPAGSYQGVALNFGVPASRNNGNPAEYESGHPLSIRTGLHWVWSTGYIFMQIDGRADTLDDGQENYDHAILYHPGTNELFRGLDWSDASFEVAGGETHTLTVEADIARAFYRAGDTLDMRSEHFTHSTPVGSDAFSLAERVVNNFTSAGFSIQ